MNEVKNMLLLIIIPLVIGIATYLAYKINKSRTAKITFLICAVIFLALIMNTIYLAIFNNYNQTLFVLLIIISIPIVKLIENKI